jgi:hypothetical protein
MMHVDGDDATIYSGMWIGGRDAQDGTGGPDGGWSWVDGTEWGALVSDFSAMFGCLAALCL